MKKLIIAMLILLISVPAHAMRYAAFDDESMATAFAPDVQSTCDASQAQNKPRTIITPFYLQWAGKWIVSLPVEPVGIQGQPSWTGDLTGVVSGKDWQIGVIVDSIEPPVIEGVE